MGVVVQEVEWGDSLQKKQSGQVQISRERDGGLYKVAGAACQGGALMGRQSLCAHV